MKLVGLNSTLRVTLCKYKMLVSQQTSVVVFLNNSKIGVINFSGASFSSVKIFFAGHRT